MRADWEENVRTEVASLMALVHERGGRTDATYEYVLEKLTTMAIRGTAPPGSTTMAKATKGCKKGCACLNPKTKSS